MESNASAPAAIVMPPPFLAVLLLKVEPDMTADAPLPRYKPAPSKVPVVLLLIVLFVIVKAEADAAT